MNVLVDSSAWIDYFRDTGCAEVLSILIEENLIAVNDLVLSEILPPLLVQNETELAVLLREVNRQPMRIDWEEIIRLQTMCLRKGVNGVGIPDLLIAQNAMQGDIRLLSNDKHFRLISKHTGLQLFA